jgi:microsomal dipeptidase-like Zn-dependent dipeptidase
VVIKETTLISNWRWSESLANSCLIDEGLATIEDVVKHIRYIKELIGIEHVALGSDLGGLTVNIPEGLRDVDSFCNLEKALLEGGFSDQEIEKIFYINACKFLKNALSIKQKQEEYGRATSSCCIGSVNADKVKPQP